MKIVIAGAFAALALAGATFVAATPASAHLNFGVSINIGDVQFGYRDGYWDRWHRWHPWMDRDDWVYFRNHFPGQYWDWRHDRDPDMGWRIAATPMGGPPPVTFSFAVGDVLYAYRDGYWDRWHRWHPWGSEGEWIWWRNHYPNLYWDWRHDRDADMGWHAVVTAPVGFSFAVGDVVFAYRDGYWDRGHRWHPWATRDEWAWWRNHYPGRYWDWRHDRDPDMGWRDWH